MKIYQLIFCLTSGGAERLVLNLSNELSKEHKVSIICIQKIDKGHSFYKNLISSNINIIDLGNTKGYNLKAFYQVFKLIKKYKPDVVHAHLNTLIYCFLPALLLSRNVKYFHTLHNIAEKVVGFKFQKSINRFFYKTKITAIGISDICGESFKKLYNLADITVIENGVPEPKKTALYNNVITEFEEYRKTKNTKVFINIARISEQKNHTLMISTFNKLIKEGQDISLIIIGRSDNKIYYENLKSISTNGIYFLGEKTNPIDYLMNADCFVLSSKWEGLPMTILEAMACGLPILSTPVGGVPDAIKQKFLGVLSSGLTENEFYHAIETYLNEDIITYNPKLIHNYYSENFSIYRTSLKHISLYKF